MEVRSAPGMKTSTPSSHQMARSVIYFVIHSSTAILLRFLLSVNPRTLPLGTSAPVGHFSISDISPEFAC